MTRLCNVYRLGLVAYQPAWELQDRLAGQIAQGLAPPALLLLQHPHVFTFGRRGQAANLLWDAEELARRGVEVLWVDRGGDVTYHGPGQLVGYPLLPLAPGGLYAGTNPGESTSSPGSLPRADYVGYIRRLEQVLILALTRLGLTGRRWTGRTGVWVETGDPARLVKIAAIGVKVDARGVSRHGFALNVDPDMSFWDGILACGLPDSGSASLAGLLDRPPSMEAVEQALIDAFGEVFDYQLVEGRTQGLLLEGADI